MLKVSFIRHVDEDSEFAQKIWDLTYAQVVK